ncbi:hypothetical protein K474DRAFT_1706336 [Panus rudis PR-1116 ss-1]|nr:hypothetical protein K474DRAFT_1706336 [Panus rudis PR-1116 ss-1]
MPPVYSLPSSRKSTLNANTGKRKALLVGITYNNGEESVFGQLVGPYEDVEALRSLLIDQYAYKAEDITVMLDKPDFPPHLKPTRKNLIREICALVHDPKQNDHFVFHFSGHSDQIENKTGTEEDGQDEVIVTADSTQQEPRFIRDNDLKRYLVEPLPFGASLVCVFDCCHSATLLDLGHYNCTKVWVPWVSKGARQPKSEWINVDRKPAYFILPRGISTNMRVSDTVVQSRQLSLDSASTLSKPRRKLTWKTQPIYSQRTRPPSMPLPTFETAMAQDQVGPDSEERSLSVETVVPEALSRIKTDFFNGFDMPRCGSPDTYTTQCDGDCKPYAPSSLPHVVSVAACQDTQRTWEDLEGKSMTRVMVDILRETPLVSYHLLMTKINHRLHRSAQDLHRWSKVILKQKAARRAALRAIIASSESDQSSSCSSDAEGSEASQTEEEEECFDGELVNFSDAQLGSHAPLASRSGPILRRSSAQGGSPVSASGSRDAPGRSPRPHSGTGRDVKHESAALHRAASGAITSARRVHWGPVEIRLISPRPPSPPPRTHSSGSWSQRCLPDIAAVTVDSNNDYAAAHDDRLAAFNDGGRDNKAMGPLTHPVHVTPYGKSNSIPSTPSLNAGFPHSPIPPLSAPAISSLLFSTGEWDIGRAPLLSDTRMVDHGLVRSIEECSAVIPPSPSVKVHMKNDLGTHFIPYRVDVYCGGGSTGQGIVTVRNIFTEIHIRLQIRILPKEWYLCNPRWRHTARTAQRQRASLLTSEEAQQELRKLPRRVDLLGERRLFKGFQADPTDSQSCSLILVLASIQNHAATASRGWQ